MLADVVKDQKKPQVVEISTRLTDALTASMGREFDPDFTASPPDEETLFRVSAFGKLCARMYALAFRDQFSLEKPELYDPKKKEKCRRAHLLNGAKWCRKCAAEQAWIFGTGTALHNQYQNEYLQTLGDVFQGWWRCRNCAHVHTGKKMDDGPLRALWCQKPERCSSCDTVDDVEDDEVPPLFEYVELEFLFPEYRTSGHCDGILDWNQWGSNRDDEYDWDLVEVLELKSINETGFEYVDPRLGCKPRPEHVLQVHGYLWGVEKTPVHRGRVLYTKKAAGQMLELLCEHSMPKDDKYIAAIKGELQRSIDGLNAVAEGRRLAIAEAAKQENGLVDGVDFSKIPIPDRIKDCRVKSDFRAKYCPAKDPCFARSAKKKTKSTTA